MKEPELYHHSHWDLLNPVHLHEQKHLAILLDIFESFDTGQYCLTQQTLLPHPWILFQLSRRNFDIHDMLRLLRNLKQ